MAEPTPKQSSGLAIAGLVLGILAAVTSFLPIINNLSAIIALIGGLLALIALIGALRGKHTAKGLSIAGLVLAVVSFAIVLITQSMYAAAIDSVMEEATSGSTPVAASDGTQDASGDADATGGDAGDANDAAAEDTQADYSNLAVGQSVEFDDGLVVTVNSVQTGEAKYDGSPLIGVNVTYVNNGSENATFNTYDWKGEDANGAQRSTTYHSSDSDELNSGTLSPGGTVTGNIYFEDDVVRILYYSNMFNSSASAGWVL